MLSQNRAFDKPGAVQLTGGPRRKVRELGGAILGDCRFGVYHNGAECDYAVRGFPCMLRL